MQANGLEPLAPEPQHDVLLSVDSDDGEYLDQCAKEEAIARLHAERKRKWQEEVAAMQRVDAIKSKIDAERRVHAEAKKQAELDMLEEMGLIGVPEAQERFKAATEELQAANQACDLARARVKAARIAQDLRKKA